MAEDVATAPAIDQGTPPEASLLGMPAEIRNRIYHEVLVEEEDVEFYSVLPNPRQRWDDDVDLHFEAQNAVEPGLLRCCKQIRREARSIFFEMDTFDHVNREGIVEPQLDH